MFSALAYNMKETTTNDANETAPLFDLAPPASPNDRLAKELAKIDPDNLTPKQALDILYKLKKKV